MDKKKNKRILTEEDKIKRNAIKTAQYIAMDTWEPDTHENANYMRFMKNSIIEDIRVLKEHGVGKHDQYKTLEQQLLYLQTLSEEYKRLEEYYLSKID